MKAYIEPDCQFTVLDPDDLICDSLDSRFDSVDATELFTVDDLVTI